MFGRHPQAACNVPSSSRSEGETEPAAALPWALRHPTLMDEAAQARRANGHCSGLPGKEEHVEGCVISCDDFFPARNQLHGLLVPGFV